MIDHVISELCYKGTILQRNYRKCPLNGHFPYMLRTFGSHNMTMLYPNMCSCMLIRCVKLFKAQKSMFKSWDSRAV